MTGPTVGPGSGPTGVGRVVIGPIVWHGAHVSSVQNSGHTTMGTGAAIAESAESARAIAIARAVDDKDEWMYIYTVFA